MISSSPSNEQQPSQTQPVPSVPAIVPVPISIPVSGPISVGSINVGPIPQPQPDTAKTALWMGELDPWTDENFIQQVWSSYGFDDVVVKVIRDKYTGVSQGYCFVDFGSYEEAATGLTYDGSPIPNSNKSFKLNWASGGGLQDRKEDRPAEYSIFVGDLPPETTELQLHTLFQSRYPSCKMAKIMTDPVTGASRCYGFVRFSNEQEQQRAITEMQGFYCGSRPMRISIATPKNQSKNAQVASLLHQHAQVAVHHNTNPTIQSEPSYYPSQMSRYPDPNNTTIFVGGLSSNVSEEELRILFSAFGEITYVKIPAGKGCGFVQFVTRQSAETAISRMHGYPIGNSRVRLSWGRSQNNTSNNFNNIPTNNLNNPQLNMNLSNQIQMAPILQPISVSNGITTNVPNGIPQGVPTGITQGVPTGMPTQTAVPVQVGYYQDQLQQTAYPIIQNQYYQPQAYIPAQGNYTQMSNNYNYNNNYNNNNSRHSSETRTHSSNNYNNHNYNQNKSDPKKNNGDHESYI